MDRRLLSFAIWLLAPGLPAFAQNRSAQIDTAKIGTRQIGSAQVRPRSAILTAEKALVRLENVTQLLSVVFVALEFAQPHRLFTACVDPKVFCELLFY